MLWKTRLGDSCKFNLPLPLTSDIPSGSCATPGPFSLSSGQGRNAKQSVAILTWYRVYLQKRRDVNHNARKGGAQMDIKLL